VVIIRVVPVPPETTVPPTLPVVPQPTLPVVTP
jgi:hypothetical protein